MSRTRFLCAVAVVGLLLPGRVGWAQPATGGQAWLPPPGPPPAASAAAPPPSPAPVAASPSPVVLAPSAAPPGYMWVPASALYPAVGQRTQPDQLPYEDGQKVPAGYRVVERARTGLVVGGAVTLGVSWMLSVTAAAASDFDDDTGFLVIPALGPWLMLAAGGARNDCDTHGDVEYCEDRSGLRGVLVLDGMTQTAGAILLLAGVFYPSKRLVREPVAWSVTPTRIGQDGYGLGAVGTF